MVVSFNEKIGCFLEKILFNNYIYTDKKLMIMESTSIEFKFWKSVVEDDIELGVINENLNILQKFIAKCSSVGWYDVDVFNKLIYNYLKSC